MDPNVIITDWNRHVLGNSGHQPATVQESVSAGGAERSSGTFTPAQPDGTKSFDSGSRGSKSLSNSMDWWNKPGSDTLSDHSEADTDRESPMPKATQEEVAREVAGRHEVEVEYTDWGALQAESNSVHSPCFRFSAGPNVPDLAVDDDDVVVRSEDRAMQSLMAARATSNVMTERDGLLSGLLPVREIKRLMEEDAKVDEKLSNTLAGKLQTEIHEADVRALKDQHWTRDPDSAFLYGSRPQMSVVDFLMRVAKYSAASPSCFLLAQIYIGRLRKVLPRLQLNSLTFQRLLLASTMLSAKMFDDFYHSNAVWAKIGGISTQELNAIEVKLLGLLRWNATISWEEFSYQRLLLSSAQAHASPAAVSSANLWAFREEPAPPPPHASNPDLRVTPRVQLDRPAASSYSLHQRPASASFAAPAAPLHQVSHHLPAAASSSLYQHQQPARPASLNFSLSRAPSASSQSGYNDPEALVSSRTRSAAVPQGPPQPHAQPRPQPVQQHMAPSPASALLPSHHRRASTSVMTPRGMSSASTIQAPAGSFTLAARPSSISFPNPATYSGVVGVSTPSTPVAFAAPALYHTPTTPITYHTPQYGGLPQQFGAMQFRGYHV